MLKELPEEEFGRGINIREYSFLENPSLPKQVIKIKRGTAIVIFNLSVKIVPCIDALFQVKESWLDVQLCQGGSQDCNVSNSTTPPGVLRFPKNSKEEMVY